MEASIYFAPTFFAPTFFAPLAYPPTPPAPAPPRQLMATSFYFAPTYFAPTYFASLAPASVPKPPPLVPFGSSSYGDRDAFAAILSALEATGAFEAVVFATPLDRLALAALGTPLVSLVPEGWEEFDEFDPTAILRRVTFRLDLLARDEDPFARYAQVASLEAAAHDALEGSDLGGGCLPALTRLRRAQYDPKPLHPEQSARIVGEFTYIPGSTIIPVPTP